MHDARIPNAEGTAFPWWAIIDPRPTRGVRAYDIASMITGVFLSRRSAEEHLADNRHNFGRNASVFCFSGHRSEDWQRLCLEPTAQDGQNRAGSDTRKPE